ncbi:MAG: chemotaxis protein CheB [Pseudomonadota bacterium]|nr:chemotaxis protein CheB [Pseudomonadota bacterium]
MTTIPLRYPAEFPLICVGGSAGAVDAMRQLAGAMPERFPAPLLLILHRKNPPVSDAKFLLPELMRSVSKLEVICPEDGTVIRSGRIYVMPHGTHAIVDDNQFHLVDEPADCQWRPSIDVLFKSAARQYRDRVIAVLLSGMLDDGVAGLRAVTREGGITVAQSPEDAAKPDLPLNAIMKDHPNYVLPLKDMVKLFCELCHFPGFPDQEQIVRDAAITAHVDKAMLKGS